MRWPIVLLLAGTLGLSACAQNPHHLNTMYLDRFASADPTPASFTVCHGFHCTEKKAVSLNREQWRRVAAVFEPRAKTAPQERQQIARGLALVQSFVGPQTGTAVRQWTHRNMYILPNLGDLSQLDCIDASVNTWTYMTMMERAGFMRHHRVAQLSYAGSLMDPDVRNTAVLEEKNGGYFAVDASLVDHAEPPLVMSLAVWLDTWPPNPAAIERVAKPDAAAPPARIAGRTRSGAMSSN